MRKSRYSSRYLEILAILRKNSLLKKYNKIKEKAFDEELSDEKNRDEQIFGQALRESFEELGPTYIKFGQMLSTRTDIFPEIITNELARLQDQVPAFDSDEAISMIEEELSMEMDEIFASFEKEPIAQGSIAQVHSARLLDGRKVAVKVQRPGIKESINLDLAIMESLVPKFNKFIKLNEIVNFVDLVDEFRDQIINEIDFVKEANNLIRFSLENRDDKYVFTPYLHKRFIREKVIVMDFVEAKSIKTLTEDQVEEYGEEIAKRLIYSYTNQVFEHGYFHADPHPGNILINDNLDIFLTDFGIVGVLSDRKKYTLLKLFMGISLSSTRIILTSLIELGSISNDVNTSAFEFEVRHFLDKYMKLSLKEIKIAEIFNSFIKLLYKFEIRIDRSLLSLGKTILILEGVIEFLDKKSSLLELSRPIAKKLFKRFVSIDYLKNYLVDSSVDIMELLVSAPRTVLDFSRKLEENAYELKFAHREDQRIIQLEIEKTRQTQRNVFLAISVFIFLVSLLTLSFGEDVRYGIVWTILLIVSAIFMTVIGVYSLYKYIEYDRNK